MKRAAIKILIRIVRETLPTLPIARQIEVYKALAEVMPTKKERTEAKQIAWLLRTTEKHQLDFSKQLFTGLQKPGRAHDGDGQHDGGKA